jgi:hypothetical protein
MNIVLRHIILLLIALYSSSIHGQSSKIVVSGVIVSSETGAVPMAPLLVVKHKGTGGFADLSGRFTLVLGRKDTLLITARNHEVKTYTFADVSDSIFLNVKLSLPGSTLRTVVVRPVRVVSEVHRDLAQIKKEMPDFPTGFEAISSPITALYSRFSRMERSRQQVAEWEYRDKKQELLKELFQLYVDADIIALSPEEFDDFIAYCNPGDYFLRNAKEHELVSYFQLNFRRYVRRYIDTD